jgi:hypothetical protein
MARPLRLEAAQCVRAWFDPRGIPGVAARSRHKSKPDPAAIDIASQPKVGKHIDAGPAN